MLVDWLAVPLTPKKYSHCSSVVELRLIFKVVWPKVLNDRGLLAYSLVLAEGTVALSNLPARKAIASPFMRMLLVPLTCLARQES